VVDEDVQGYIDGIDPANRPLFDRVHGLIREVCPEVEVTFAYKMPTFVQGERGLHVASWKHGLSFYGWQRDRDAGFADRHPDLAGPKGTLRLSPKAAEDIGDDELRDFLRAVFS
jgi:uncharacterized protein YdhG (YjbR/CyaY superfamily)